MSDITAASYKQPDVNQAIASMQPGDTVIVPPFPPEGDVWHERSDWNIPENGRILFSGKDKSKIIDGYKPSADPTHTADSLINIYPHASGRFRCTGFTLKGDAKISNYKYALITVAGQNKKFRMDNYDVDTSEAVYEAFSWAVPSGIQFWGHITGVLDHWRLFLSDRGAMFIVHYNGYGGGTEGDESWAADAGHGTSDFIFAEDFEVHNPGAGGVIMDAYHGGKWSVRKGKLYGAGFGQTHPTGGSGRARGARAWEAVDIEAFLSTSGKSNFNGFFLSSGSGVVTRVIAHPNAYSNLMTVHSMRVPGSSSYNQWPPPDGWGFFPSIYDKVDSAFDQPGKGKSDLLRGNFPDVFNVTQNKPAVSTRPNQMIEGVYEWDNVWSNPGGGGNKIAIYESAQIQVGRDIFPDTPKPGWVPYPYPHPLTLEGGPDPEPPDPPDPPDPQPEPEPEPNESPVVKSMVLKSGATVLDPAQPITVKDVKIEIVGTDDKGLTRMEIWVANIMLKYQIPEGDSTESKMTAPWNTRPYKGKTVSIRAVLLDADGATTTKTITVTVKK